MAKKRFIVLALTVLVVGGVFAQAKGFSIGVRAIGIMPTYEPSSDFEKALGGISVDLEGDFGFGFAVQAGYNFSDTFGIQAEILYNSDEVAVKAMGIEAATLKASSLLIPVLLRVGTTIGDGIQLSGIGGIYLTVPIGDGEIKLSPLAGGASAEGEWKGSIGAMIGGIVGYKIGPGVLFADIRYGFDFLDTEFEFMGSTEKVLKKSAFHIGVGYSITIGE
ncbi:outer membrane beta-barrel protein [Treponema sp. R80B11-R83G3]